MADPLEDGERPVRPERGRRSRSRERDEAVPGALDEQGGRRDATDHRVDLTAARQREDDRARGLEERLVAPRHPVHAVSRQRHVRRHDLCRDPSRVGADELQRIAHETLGAATCRPPAHESLAQPGNGIGGEGERHDRVEARARWPRLSRPDEHQTSHLLRLAFRLHHGEEPAHRVPDQGCRPLGHRVDEPVEELGVCPDVSRSSGEGGAAKPRQIGGQDTRPRRERRPHGEPVEMRPAEPVDQDHRRSRAAEVSEVNRPSEVDGARAHPSSYATSGATRSATHARRQDGQAIVVRSGVSSPGAGTSDRGRPDLRRIGGWRPGASL